MMNLDNFLAFYFGGALVNVFHAIVHITIHLSRIMATPEAMKVSANMRLFGIVFGVAVTLLKQSILWPLYVGAELVGAWHLRERKQR